MCPYIKVTHRATVSSALLFEYHESKRFVRGYFFSQNSWKRSNAYDQHVPEDIH